VKPAKVIFRFSSPQKEAVEKNTLLFFIVEHLYG
jgi:hypothetical protein